VKGWIFVGQKIVILTNLVLIKNKAIDIEDNPLPPDVRYCVGSSKKRISKKTTSKKNLENKRCEKNKARKIKTPKKSILEKRKIEKVNLEIKYPEIDKFRRKKISN
jgi:hypothetical protein